MGYKDLRAELLVLQAKKLEIEEEASLLLEVLNSCGPDGSPAPGLSQPLVDAEGYPRSDIDLYVVRQQRHRLAVLKTDRKKVEADIEAKLVELHRAIQHEPQEEKTEVSSPKKFIAKSPKALKTSTKKGDDCVPLAVVNQVMKGSPAELAGLEEGDRILEFGQIKQLANMGVKQATLGDISAVVGSNINQTVPVVVLRDGSSVSLSLVPQQWAGRGVLGCHLLPL
mmetsp:Transcript_2521/g.4164  ORF Transcript_2521/g.4164 Transcript_2521/m.4164 type:complete len:225 (+) Transcript_2521:232-906(+)